MRSESVVFCFGAQNARERHKTFVVDIRALNSIPRYFNNI